MGECACIHVCHRIVISAPGSVVSPAIEVQVKDFPAPEAPRNHTNSPARSWNERRSLRKGQASDVRLISADSTPRRPCSRRATDSRPSTCSQLKLNLIYMTACTCPSHAREEPHFARISSSTCGPHARDGLNSPSTCSYVMPPSPQSLSGMSRSRFFRNTAPQIKILYGHTAIYYLARAT